MHIHMVACSLPPTPPRSSDGGRGSVETAPQTQPRRVVAFRIEAFAVRSCVRACVRACVRTCFPSVVLVLVLVLVHACVLALSSCFLGALVSGEGRQETTMRAR